MPKLTPNYKLISFLRNERFNASLDQSRMRTIDQLLGFVADRIGDGIINGWTVEDSSSSNGLSITIREGNGLIARKNVFTYGDIVFDFPANSTKYLYMQSKYEMIGGESRFSPIVQVTNTDSTAPSNPTGLAVDSVDYNYITLTWNANTEEDFYRYVIYRSTNNITYTEISTSITNEFTDETVEENTTYYYKIKAEDVNNNISGFSSSVSQLTSLDLRPPLNPTNVLVFPLNNAIQIAWDNPKFGDIDSYEIQYHKVDGEYNQVGGITTLTALSSDRTYLINSLDNGRSYKITIYAISVNGIYSSGYSTIIGPKNNNGPVEISSMNVSDFQSTKQSYSIGLDIEIIPGSDPYLSAVSKYYIVLYENGSIESQPIEAFDLSSTKIEVFTQKNGLKAAVKPRTNYIIKVYGKDSKGNANNGIISHFTTGNYLKPSSVTNITANIINSTDLIISWENSKSKFSYNKISLTKKNLDTNVTTTIESNLNYEKKQSYIINTIEYNYQYTIYITPVDEFAIEGNTINYSYNTEEVPEILPGQVQDVIAFSSKGSVTLEWSPYNNAKEYYIWRSLYKEGVQYSDFSLIDTVTTDNTSYTDYTVEDNTGYFYFITVKDKYDNQSKNPVDDNYAFYPYTLSYNAKNTEILPPTNLTIYQDGYDAVLNWDQSIDGFDFYEVYKSIGDKINWEKIGFVNNLGTTFRDYNGLLYNKTYYYMVRKNRNEAQYILTNTKSSPKDSILLAKIISSDDNLSIEDLSVNISNYENLNINPIINSLNNHKHIWTEIKDKRIDLRRSIIIDSWYTSDNINYYTLEKIPTSSKYLVKINGTPSTYLFTVDTTNKLLKFGKKIPLNATVELLCFESSEIQNKLNKTNVNNLTGNVIQSGLLIKEQIPKINHKRIKEDLIPLQVRMVSDNNLYYKILDDTDFENFQINVSNITFYDCLKLDDKEYIYATNNGIFRTIDDNTSFSLIAKDKNYPFIKFYYNNNKYYAIAGNTIYISENGISWQRTFGTEDASIIRDIVELSNGYIYASSDCGVFYIRNDEYSNVVYWRRTNNINKQSINSFALIDDTYFNRLIVSTDIGLFETTDNGNSWSYISEIKENVPIYQFYVSNSYVYAISDNYLYRKYESETEFIKVAEINNGRKIGIINDIILITTNNGFLYCKNGIYSNSRLEFYKLEQIFRTTQDTRFNVNPDPCLLKASENEIIIGSDGLLWRTVNNNKFDLIYESVGTDAIPTVYINNNVIKNGYYYDNNGILFDNQVKENSFVTVATQYTTYIAKNGGWLNKNYLAGINIYVNYIRQYSITSGNIPNDLADNYINQTFDEFKEPIWNTKYAKEYLSKYETSLNRYLNVVNSLDELSTNETLADLVNTTVNDLYSIYTQNVGNNIYCTKIDTINGLEADLFNIGNEFLNDKLINIYFNNFNIIPIFPEYFLTLDNGVNINIANGLIKFPVSYTKYTSLKLTLDNEIIQNNGINSHRQLEDKFQLVNNGLPQNLSNIRNSNLINYGIFEERDTEEEVSLKNGDIYVPVDKEWYEKINSTIDYQLESYAEPDPIDINFVNSIVLIDNKVWIAADNGLYVLETDSVTIAKVNFNSNSSDMFVNDIFVYDSTIYVLTNKYVYYTQDDGVNWNYISLFDLKEKPNKIIANQNYIIITTNQKVYYKSIFERNWQEVLSIEEGIFSSIINPDFIFLTSIKENNTSNLYFSKDGMTWENKGVINTGIKSMLKFKSNILLATTSGLQTDSSSFYGCNPIISVMDIANDLVLSKTLDINAVGSNENNTKIIAGGSNGYYYVYDGGTWTEYRDSKIKSIHHALFVNSNDYWAFGHNLLKIKDLFRPIKLSTGVGF